MATTTNKKRIQMYDCKPMCFGSDGHRRDEGKGLDLAVMQERWYGQRTMIVPTKQRSLSADGQRRKTCSG